MKRTILFTSIIAILCSCHGKHDYELKLIYMTTNSSGVPILVNRGSYITAPTDSAAYEKALEISDYKYKMNEKELHDQFDHFELYNSANVLVTRK